MNKFRVEVNTQHSWQRDPQWEEIPNAEFESREEAERAPEQLVRVCGYPKKSEFRIVEVEEE